MLQSTIIASLGRSIPLLLTNCYLMGRFAVFFLRTTHIYYECNNVSKVGPI